MDKNVSDYDDLERDRLDAMEAEEFYKWDQEAVDYENDLLNKAMKSVKSNKE